VTALPQRRPLHNWRLRTNPSQAGLRNRVGIIARASSHGSGTFRRVFLDSEIAELLEFVVPKPTAVETTPPCRLANIISRTARDSKLRSATGLRCSLHQRISGRPPPDHHGMICPTPDAFLAMNALPFFITRESTTVLR